MMSAAVAALATLVVGFTMIAPSANRDGHHDGHLASRA
jgi:hypothetical protein